MLLASAMSDESAYSARFTKTLATIWQSSTPSLHCGRRRIESFISSSLKSIPGVSPDAIQNVRLVAPLSPDFCIESLNYTNRLLFLSNAAPGDVTVTLQPQDDPDAAASFSLRQNEVAPVNLRAVTYSLIAKRNPDTGEAPPVVKSIDLTSIPAKTEVLFSSDSLDEAAATEQAAQYLDARSMFPASANDLHTQSKNIIYQRGLELNSALQRLASEAQTSTYSESQLATALESQRKLYEQAKTEKDSAASKAINCGPESCTRAYSELQQANALFTQAQAEYENSRTIALSQESAQQNLIARTRLVQNRLEVVEDLKSRLERYDKAVADAETAKKTLLEELVAVFPDVRSTEGRMTVTLSNPDTGEKTLLAFKQLASVVNKHPTLRVEIELQRPGRNSLEEQLAVRRDARHLQQMMRDANLQTEFLTARGIISMVVKRTIANIVFSQPAPAEGSLRDWLALSASEGDDPRISQ